MGVNPESGPAVSRSLADLAVKFGCELDGDPDQQVHTVATLQDASAGSIAFLANPGYRRYLAGTQASAVILAPELAAECEVSCLITHDPYGTYAAIAAELHPSPPLQPGVHPAATVDPASSLPESCQIAAGVVIGAGVELGERVYVGPNCVLGDGVRIGADTRLAANVTLYHSVVLGSRCLVHAGAVIGADGFGIAPTPSGWLKVPQLGSVIVGDDVEIGAACTIDRGAIEDTRIEAGVKLDNQVHVAHNVVVGAHTAIAAQTGISGSTRIGQRCMVGGQTGLAGHISVCDDVVLLGHSIVTGSITSAGMYSSVLPVEEVRTWRRLAARFKRLEEMAKKLRLLEKRMDADDKGTG